MTTLSLKKKAGGDTRVAHLAATGNPDAIDVSFWATIRTRRSSYAHLVKDGEAVWSLADFEQAISDGWDAPKHEIAAFRRQVADGKKHDPFDGIV